MKKNKKKEIKGKKKNNHSTIRQIDRRRKQSFERSACLVYRLRDYRR